jgi:hypothetical protein
MLAAIIANLQNQRQPKLPTIQIDRGGGGPSWPRADIADIISALGSFQERFGEHPVARAVRRHQHVGDQLGSITERRERREASAFLTGAVLGRAAAIEEMGMIMDEVRKAACAERAVIVPVGHARGGSENLFGAVLFAAAAIGVVVIAKRLSA